MGKFLRSYCDYICIVWVRRDFVENNFIVINKKFYVENIMIVKYWGDFFSYFLSFVLSYFVYDLWLLRFLIIVIFLNMFNWCKEWSVVNMVNCELCNFIIKLNKFFYNYMFVICMVIFLSILLCLFNLVGWFNNWLFVFRRRYYWFDYVRNVNFCNGLFECIEIIYKVIRWGF